MAQKIITDLTLRGSVEDTVNFPVDDTIQTYRVTAAQIKAYILPVNGIDETLIADDLIHDLTAVTPSAADYIAIADTSDSNKNKKILLADLKNNLYRSVVTTDAIGIDDQLLVLSGASFTATLPTAVGVEGKCYELIHNGTSQSQIYTIATTSSQVIGTGSAITFKLYNKGEKIKLVSNGTKWLVLDHNDNAADAELWLHTGNGHGSTNTTVRRLTTAAKNTIGNYATYADSATLGMSITVIEPGIYAMGCADYRGAGGQTAGFSVNGTALTTGMSAINYADGMRVKVDISTNLPGAVGELTLSLVAGDVVRMQTTGTANATDQNCRFTMKLLKRVY